MRRNKYIYERLATSEVSGLLLDVREVRNCAPHGPDRIWTAIMKNAGPNVTWGYGLGMTEDDSYAAAVEIMDMKAALEQERE